MREEEIKMWKKFKRTKSQALREEIVKKYMPVFGSEVWHIMNILNLQSRTWNRVFL